MTELATHPDDLLLQFMEHDLTPSQEESVAGHVENCPSCRAWCETFGALVSNPSSALADRHPSADSIARHVIAPESLDEERRQLLSSHLARCEPCREEAALVAEGVKNELASYETPAPAMRRLMASRAVQLAASLLLLVGLLASPLFRPTSEEPAAQMQIDGQLLEGERIIEAGVSVEVTDTEIALGSDVVFRAGDTVALGNGFSVAEGAVFSVETGIAESHADSG